MVLRLHVNVAAVMATVVAGAVAVTVAAAAVVAAVADLVFVIFYRQMRPATIAYIAHQMNHEIHSLHFPSPTVDCIVRCNCAPISHQ